MLLPLFLPSLFARRSARFAALLFLALFLALLPTLWPLAAYAGTMTVNGTCTLPTAIDSANFDLPNADCPVDGALGSTDTILLPPLTSFDGTTLSSSGGDGLMATPSIISTIIISGGVAGATVERTDGPQFRLFYVSVLGDLTLEHVTVRNGNSDFNGGGIFNIGALTLLDSTIISNTAVEGGGIYNSGDSFFRGTTTLTNSTIISNLASAMGGGLFSTGEQSAVSLTDSFVVSNTAVQNGGGIFSTGNQSAVSLTGSFVQANTTFQNGGGIFSTGEVTLTLTDSNVASNQASFDGGGLYNDSGAAATLIDSHVLFNKTVNRGAGIFNNLTANLILTDSNIFSNVATFDGGGLYNTMTSTVTLTNSPIASNRAAAGNGGGLYNSNTSTATLTNSDILTNTAGINGGGLYNIFTSTAIITVSNVVSNTALVGNGGAFYQDSGSLLSIAQARIVDNGAGVTGGALLQSDGATTIDQSCIVGNSNTAVEYMGGNDIDATGNWWGAANGPGGVRPGAGDSVSADVDVNPVSDVPLAGCPIVTADLAFSKRASASGALLPGQPLTYTLTITNQGANTVNGVYVTDTLPAEFVTGGVNFGGDATISFNGSSYVIEEMAAAQVGIIEIVGQIDAELDHNALVHNTATLTNSLVETLTGTADVNVVLPELNWTQQTYVTSEDQESFTATLTLTPTDPYESVSVEVAITDTSENGLVASAIQGVIIAAGSGSRQVVIPIGADGVVVSRTIQLSLQNPDSALLGEIRSATITVINADAAPDLAVTKIANRTQATAGDTILYTYFITNTGNVTFTTISAHDDKLGNLDDLAGTLAPNGNDTATVSYVVQLSDPVGPLINTVTVTGTDGVNTLAVVSDTAAVTIQEPDVLGLVVDKSANRTQATAGETIIYTYQLTNTGNVTFTAISAVDDHLGEIDDLEIVPLAPNAILSATVLYVVKPSDPLELLTNTVVVTGTDVLGTETVTSDDAVVLIGAPTNLPPNEQPHQQGMELYLPRVVGE